MGQQTGRVLLVDDDSLIRKSISRHLVAAGYVVRAAVDGLDAIKILRGGPLNLIISDLNMPGMSGLEFLDVVRKRFPQIPVILISGVAANELPEGVAADAYCHKNEFLSDQLLQTISDLNRKPHPRPPPQYVEGTPFQAIWDSAGNSIIGCEDCLREFSIPPVPNIVRYENWTICVHCGKPVQFLAAEHSDGK
jgi:CheY-like chemotaxis protein